MHFVCLLTINWSGTYISEETDSDKALGPKQYSVAEAGLPFVMMPKWCPSGRMLCLTINQIGGTGANH